MKQLLVVVLLEQFHQFGNIHKVPGGGNKSGMTYLLFPFFKLISPIPAFPENNIQQFLVAAAVQVLNGVSEF